MMMAIFVLLFVFWLAYLALEPHFEYIKGKHLILWYNNFNKRQFLIVWQKS
jgi:hypothetical protein